MEELPHVAARREAYRACGAEPQRTRNSPAALLRRAECGCLACTGSPTSTTPLQRLGPEVPTVRRLLGPAPPVR